MSRNITTIIIIGALSLLWASNDAMQIRRNDFPVVTGRGLETSPTENQINVADSKEFLSIPQMLNYQGKLTDATGNPVRDSTYSVSFRLFTVPSSGTSFWNEIQNVQTRQGLFNVLLGSSTLIPYIPSDGNCYLEMQVNPNPPMTPRIRIVSAAYAYVSRKADSANYAASSPIARPITPPVVGSEIIKPCSLQASILYPNALLWIKNTNTGNGVLVDSAGASGVFVNRAGYDGVAVNRAGHEGFAVYRAASNGVFIDSAGYNGITINRPTYSGLVVVGAGEDALYARKVGLNGIHIDTAGVSGFVVTQAGQDGIYVDSAGFNGVYVKTASYSGFSVSNAGWDGLSVLRAGRDGLAVYRAEWNGVYIDTTGYCGLSVSHAGSEGVYVDNAGTDGIHVNSATNNGVYASGNQYAGYFNGNFLATNGTKSAAVKVDEGDWRLLYCQESPEVWFEDAGEGQLQNGKVRIELDPIFLKTVTISAEYPMKVFVQLCDDCNGVFVKRGVMGFDVIELQNGTSNARFTYRVMAKRKGYENLRLKKMEPGTNPEEIEAKNVRYRAEMENDQQKPKNIKH
jgi:hypothetical protein